MFVGKRMQHDPITVRPEDSMRLVINLLKEKRIRSIPVVQGKRLAGIVTDRDVRQASASSATSLEIRELHYLLEKIKVQEIMTKSVITATPETSIEEAAKILHDNKINALPVLERGELVGIITTIDIMEVLIEVLGMGVDGSRIEVLVDDKPGELLEICKIVKSHDVNIVSVVTSKNDMPGKKILVFKLKTKELDTVRKAIEDGGYKVLSAFLTK